MDRDHRRAAGVNRVDDLGVANALEVDRGDADVGDRAGVGSRSAAHLAGHLNGVPCRNWCDAKRRRTPAARAMRRRSERAAFAEHGRPCAGPLTTQNSGRTSSLPPRLEPGRSSQSSMPISRRRPSLPRRTSNEPRRASRPALEAVPEVAGRLPRAVRRQPAPRTARLVASRAVSTPAPACRSGFVVAPAGHLVPGAALDAPGLLTSMWISSPGRARS